MKKYIIVSLFSLLVLFYSCGGNTPVITPIDTELNEQYLKKELDPAFFSGSNILQYYEISGYKAMPPSVLQASIDSFIDSRYSYDDIRRFESVTILIYKKALFSRYNVYEAARESENGSLYGYEDDLVARTGFEKLAGDGSRLIRFRLLYDNNKLVMNTRDTIELR
jgi:hypothetical protein